MHLMIVKADNMYYFFSSVFYFEKLFYICWYKSSITHKNIFYDGIWQH